MPVCCMIENVDGTFVLLRFSGWFPGGGVFMSGKSYDQGHGRRASHRSTQFAVHYGLGEYGRRRDPISGAVFPEKFTGECIMDFISLENAVNCGFLTSFHDVTWCRIRNLRNSFCVDI